MWLGTVYKPCLYQTRGRCEPPGHGEQFSGSQGKPLRQLFVGQSHTSKRQTLGGQLMASADTPVMTSGYRTPSPAHRETRLSPTTRIWYDV